MHGHCQNSVPQEFIWVLSWKFHKILKGEYHLTKRQYVDTTANSTITTIFTTNTSIATNLGLKVLKRVFQEVYEHTGYQEDISVRL